MSKQAISLLAALVLVLSAVALASAQETKPTTTTTVTKTVQNPDGTYTIIEYPTGKETTVTLTPVGVANANGVATILRDDKGTQIKLNLTGLPADVTTLNLYAVDDNGVVTSLGPIAIASGAGTFATTTPLNKFMLIASPEGNLTAYNTGTKILFRSSVPEGFAVIPLRSSGERDGAPVGERVAATSTSGETSAYRVPMLNIPGFRRGTDTHMRINFSGALTGARANVFLEPRKDGPTEIKMRFHELKDAPSGKIYVLWAVSPDNKFVKLGQIVNSPGRNEAEIKSETSLKDFGLLVTMEDAGEITSPAGPNLGVVEIIK